MRLILRSDAETDIASRYEWYEHPREAPGAEFVEEISSTIDAGRSALLRLMQLAKDTGITRAGLCRALLLVAGSVQAARVLVKKLFGFSTVIVWIC